MERKTLLNMLGKHFFIFSVLIILTCTSTLAQESTAIRKKGSWIVLPAISVMPETGLSLGAIGMRLFKFNYKDTLTRTSNLQAVAIYTLNNQLLLGHNYNLFFNKEKYITYGLIEYQQFPEYFYGIGNNPVSSENREQINYTYFRFENRFCVKSKDIFLWGHD
ncbi:MAG: hypothetical protein HC912_02545 [Saprospiraceae bacterium]|nr:hypothetical protein [Saprospiraceae bacterium]